MVITFRHQTFNCADRNERAKLLGAMRSAGLVR